jgi:hypothetical protein
MKLASLVAATFLIAPLGIAPTQAATPSGVEALAGVCQPTLNAGCSKAICASVSSARRWPEGEQTALGAFASQVVNADGQRNPGAASKIAGCVAAGPKAVSSAFSAGSIPDIGTDSGSGAGASPQ